MFKIKINLLNKFKYFNKMFLNVSYFQLNIW